MSCLSMPAVSSRLFDWKMRFAVAALACGLGISGVTADAQCSQSGGNYTTTSYASTTYKASGSQAGVSVAAGGGTTTPSTSIITVPSFPSGTIVTCVSLVLNGVTSNGTGTYASMSYASFMLTGPGSQKLEFLGATGDGTDGDDTGTNDSGPYGLNNLTITVGDGATATDPYRAPWPNTCTLTPTANCPVIKPSSYYVQFNTENPPLPVGGSATEWASTDGTGTFASIFENKATPGGLWTLSLLDNDTTTDGDPVSVTSWTLVLTTEQTANVSTVTSLSSNSTNATSFTSGTNSSVTLTSTVTADGDPVTSGTVKFSDGTNTISGCSAVAVSNGQATCSHRLHDRGDPGAHRGLFRRKRLQPQRVEQP